MEFLAEDPSSIPEPSAEQLKTWFDANAQRFASPARVSFRHLYFSPDRHGEDTQKAAAKALESLAGASGVTPQAAALGDAFMFQDSYGDRTLGQIATLFGPDFARSLFALKPGAWHGPIESGYGWHLIWIDSMTPARIPAFEEVESLIKPEWLAEQREQAKRKMFETMRARYQVVLPELPATPIPAGPAPAPKRDATVKGK
jgi:peptidyl-prolyl cis-trans isomerase C